MRRFGDIPGKHFAAASRRAPASWREAAHRLRLGLAEYRAFVSHTWALLPSWVRWILGNLAGSIVVNGFLSWVELLLRATGVL